MPLPPVAALQSVRTADAQPSIRRGCGAPPLTEHTLPAQPGGADRDRTDDLLNANQALSRLSYGPDQMPNSPTRRHGSNPFGSPRSSDI
jgi:hypothetical protein